MSLLVVELFMATATDVFEGLALLEVIFVGFFFFATCVVEIHADLVVSHVVLWDTIDVGLPSCLPF